MNRSAGLSRLNFALKKSAFLHFEVNNFLL
jgi:hypothetical protein